LLKCRMGRESWHAIFNLILKFRHPAISSVVIIGSVLIAINSNAL